MYNENYCFVPNNNCKTYCATLLKIFTVYMYSLTPFFYQGATYDRLKLKNGSKGNYFWKHSKLQTFGA